jgi:hypothetical protein
MTEPKAPGGFNTHCSPTSERTAPADEVPTQAVPASNKRLGWSLNFAQLLPISTPMPTEFRRKLETGVTNGNCLPACFAAMLECFHRGHIASRSLVAPSGDMRETVCGWIKENWERCPVFNPDMKVHEIIRLLHDFSIPESERNLRGEWGEDPASQLAKYSELCEKIYFSDAEMLMFSSMMWERRRLPVMFRVFRVEVDTELPSGWKGLHQTTTPEPDTFLDVTGSDQALLIDVAHVGHQDGWGAHYKLLIHGSIDGLTACRNQQQPPPQAVSPSMLPPKGARRRRLLCNSPRVAQSSGDACKRGRDWGDADLGFDL